MSKHRLSPYNAYYHNGLTLKVTGHFGPKTDRYQVSRIHTDVGHSVEVLFKIRHC